MPGIKIGNLDIQFGKDWDQAKGNQLVQSLQQVISAVRTLSNATTAPPTPGVAVHELADDAGLGVDHTVEGLVPNQVLIATAENAAHFDFLHFEQIFKTDPVSFATPTEGDVITFHDGFWTAVPTTAFSLTDPGTDAIAMWDTTVGGTGGLAWMLSGTGIKITSGRIAVDDTQLVHGHLLGLLADDHPQYALAVDTARIDTVNTFALLQTFTSGLLSNADITLNGNWEQSGQEPEQRIVNTDDTADEGAWRLHAEPGQLMFATVSDDGADGENWLTVTRIAELADQVNVESNAFTWNGFDVLVAAPIAGSPFLDVYAGGAHYQLVTTAEPLGSGGGGSLTLTDGVTTVSGVTNIAVTGATVGGATPNATLAISGSGGGTPGGVSAANLECWFQADLENVALNQKRARLFNYGLLDYVPSVIGTNSGATGTATTLNGKALLALAAGSQYAFGTGTASTPTWPMYLGTQGCTVFFVGNSTDHSNTNGIVGAINSSGVEVSISTGGALIFVNSAVAILGTSSATVPAGTPFQGNVTYDGTTGDIAFKISRTAAGTASGTTHPLTVGTGVIFGETPSVGSFIGFAAELIVFSRVLSPAEITAVENYLFAKWAV